ncbi:hypothetical protein [Fischerella sp. PCC 9605]|uniref:hypothetical protein n=1 Tax=Fischerella sp. PCC 9605 TaxID=1173024 RepID=UPI0018CC3A43|nr:hypothetical protein [Fischerella sp. PCC 9605]
MSEIPPCTISDISTHGAYYYKQQHQPKWMSSTISRSEVFNLPQMFNHRSTHDFLSSQRLQFYIGVA